MHDALLLFSNIVRTVNFFKYTAHQHPFNLIQVHISMDIAENLLNRISTKKRDVRVSLQKSITESVAIYKDSVTIF